MNFKIYSARIAVTLRGRKNLDTINSSGIGREAKSVVFPGAIRYLHLKTVADDLKGVTDDTWFA
ncbi:MAG: hypothetical protein ACE5K8_07640, partial [Candidatus Zixiibacteriota bacterium]